MMLINQQDRIDPKTILELGLIEEYQKGVPENRRFKGKPLAWFTDEYKEIRHLGKGSQGEVYLVERKRDNEQFVIKQVK